jgi:hypothetical protein
MPNEKAYKEFECIIEISKVLETKTLPCEAISQKWQLTTRP